MGSSNAAGEQGKVRSGRLAKALQKPVQAAAADIAAPTEQRRTEAVQSQGG